jgi:hypothetical protein
MKSLILSMALVSGAAQAASLVVPVGSYHWESRSYTSKATGLKTEWNESNQGIGVEFKDWRFVAIENSFGDWIGVITKQKPLYQYERLDVNFSYGVALGYKDRATDKMVIEHVTPVAALEVDYDVNDNFGLVFGAHYAGFFTLHARYEF